jgi:hypothetical protein
LFVVDFVVVVIGEAVGPLVGVVGGGVLGSDPLGGPVVVGGFIGVPGLYRGLMRVTPVKGWLSNLLRPSHQNRNHWH